MRRDDLQQLEAAGQDSFLDVTTNIVGILIILVMVVGMRAQSAPTQQQKEIAARKEQLEQQAASMERGVREAQQQLETLETEAGAQSADHETLVAAMTKAEQDLIARRSQQDTLAHEKQELRRQLDESKRALTSGQKELADLDAQQPPTQPVHHYPTPLGRMVSGKEIHFQLKDGKIAHVPIDDFIDDVRANMRNAATAVYAENFSEKVGVVGPRNGFEFRYTTETIIDRARGIVGVRTREWQLVPVGMPQGEAIDQALSARSQFRAVLARYLPSDTTITLWTYPDSFAEYRRVKDELYRVGFATAGRPLPSGVLIGGSDRGTRSTAQ